MTAYSSTAPHVTEEEERLEREKLCKEERIKIHNDVYGDTGGETNVHNVVCSPNVAILLINEALDKISPEAKIDFLRARSRTPQLVERESPAADFLKREHYDADVGVLHWLRFHWPRKCYLVLTVLANR